jgi:hypothetical protein
MEERYVLLQCSYAYLEYRGSRKLRINYAMQDYNPKYQKLRGPEIVTPKPKYYIHLTKQ